MAEESPFANFVPSTETAPAAGKPAKPPKGEKKGNKKRGPKKAATADPAQTTAPAAKPDKPPRKKRTPKKGKAPRLIKIDMTTAFTALAGLNDVDCKLLDRIAAGLAGVPKKSRSRVIVALGKIFA